MIKLQKMELKENINNISNLKKMIRYEKLIGWNVFSKFLLYKNIKM